MASRRAPPPVPRGSPAASDKKYVKATWDYKANEAGELSFTVGDIISVVSEDGSGWWIGESNGMKGQFPVNFTEPCAAPAGILFNIFSMVVGLSTQFGDSFLQRELKSGIQYKISLHNNPK
jgi:hypothetical protein